MTRRSFWAFAAVPALVLGASMVWGCGGPGPIASADAVEVTYFYLPG